MKKKRVAVLGAVREEMVGLRREIRLSEKFRKGKILTGALRGLEVILAETGVGTEKSARMTRFLLDQFTISSFISIGFAGGVRETLKIGDLLVCDTVFHADGETGFEERKARPLAHRPLDTGKTLEAIGRLAERGIRARHVGILTVRNVMGSVEEKKWVGQAYPVHAVEMETFAIVEEAKRRRVPVIALRSISDTVNETLVNIQDLVDGNGEVSRVRAGLFAIAHPGTIPRFFSLREHSRKASTVLTRAVLAVL